MAPRRKAIDTKLDNDIPIFCGQCGEKIIEGNEFCVYCGAPIVKQQKANSSDPYATLKAADTDNVMRRTQKRRSKRRKKCILVSIISLFILVALMFGGYIFSYKKCVSFAREDNFTQAERWLILPQVTKLHDNKIGNYVDAGILLQNGDYDQAYNLLSDLTGYLNSDSMLCEAQYQKACQAYSDGALDTAATLFSWCMDQSYKDSQELYEKVSTALIVQSFHTEFDAGNYEKAWSIYVDNPDVNFICTIQESNYMTAMSLYHEGNYEDAEGYFEGLSGFADSDMMYRQCVYEHAMKVYDGGNLILAYKEMKTIAGYADSESILDSMTEELYNEGIRWYNKAVENENAGISYISEYGQVYMYMTLISPYENSEYYLSQIQPFEFLFN